MKELPRLCIYLDITPEITLRKSLDVELTVKDVMGAARSSMDEILDRAMELGLIPAPGSKSVVRIHQVPEGDEQ